MLTLIPGQLAGCSSWYVIFFFCQDELQLIQAAQNKQQHGHDKLLDTASLQDTKYIGPHQIKSEDAGDSKKRERKDTDDKKEKDHKVIINCLFHYRDIA